MNDTKNKEPVPEVVSSGGLADFDALERDEQIAWIAWFAGGTGYITKYGDKWHPVFGKYECECVDFEAVWLGKFVDLGWLTVTEHRRFKALGIEGQPDSAEYLLEPTNLGCRVRDAYWNRIQANNEINHE